MDEQNTTNLSELTAEIVAAYVSNNPIAPNELADLISDVHAALKQPSGSVQEPAVVPQTPAVPIKKSVTPDYIISLEDGRKFKSLKRHLSGTFGMTPAGYRAKWGLPKDYPMVAPNYAKTRSELARSMGLGRRAAPPAAEPAPAPKRTRRSKVTA